jgi:hypothetical protein
MFSHDGNATAMAGSPAARLWTVSPPLGGDLTGKDAKLWLQVLIWSEMDANGVLGRLDRESWKARRAQFAKLPQP